MVTYILLCCTTVLELLLPCMLLAQCIPCCKHLFSSYGREHLSQGWHGMVSQFNMMSFCVRKKKPTFLMKLAAFVFLREFVNQHWYIRQVPIAYQITETVQRHVQIGWERYMYDAASYRRFNDLRGQWALRRHRRLGRSLNKPFDVSVLIWHIATDLCFYHPNTSPQCRQGEATRRGREISNYMLYLLLSHPEMLMLGTRSDLFTLASGEIVKHSKASTVDMTDEILAREILTMPTSSGGVIYNANSLAQVLMELVDEVERWDVIQGVWVEMLCYSASQCRGYLHAKSLGEGGEYLSTVWLLWSFMGMEALADRHHRSSQPPQEVGEEEEEEEEEEEGDELISMDLPFPRQSQSM
ncbi:uncharacterized protein [Aegilops tauschii subsp. strangulata]|uniref:DUF4220 domain-containing protein n=2 Tax=Aegilops tauschii TaxID=37682 RepID=A0A453DMN4_AEGTS|nr:uncharacterized protein LOC120976318 [Aegilops tauschii subsp. strangulata]